MAFPGPDHCSASDGVCCRRHAVRRACLRLNVEDELGLCLKLLDIDPAGYPAIARQWAARVLCELPLSLTDGRALLEGLHALAADDQPCDAEALLGLFRDYRLSRADQILRAWLGAWQAPSLPPSGTTDASPWSPAPILSREVPPQSQ